MVREKTVTEGKRTRQVHGAWEMQGYSKWLSGF